MFFTLLQKLLFEYISTGRGIALPLALIPTTKLILLELSKVEHNVPLHCKKYSTIGRLLTIDFLNLPASYRDTIILISINRTLNKTRKEDLPVVTVPLKISFAACNDEEDAL
jgi:hypothetical protein